MICDQREPWERWRYTVFIGGDNATTMPGFRRYYACDPRMAEHVRQCVLHGVGLSNITVSSELPRDAEKYETDIIAIRPGHPWYLLDTYFPEPAASDFPEPAASDPEEDIV